MNLFKKLGADQNLRDMYKNEPYYQDLVDWCEKYDQKSFDPSYPSLPINVFMPMIEEVFARQPYWWDENHPKKMAVTGGGASVAKG